MNISEILSIEDDHSREQAMLRYIMAQRRISVSDVAKELRVSKSHVYKYLNTRQSKEQLDKIDMAITRLTDQQGGVAVQCCPPLDLRAYSLKGLMA